MNTVLTLAFVALLTVGSAAPVFAHQPLAQGSSVSACPQGTKAASAAPEGRPTTATIVQIDRQHGLLNLETEIGRVLTFATPEDMKGLHEGDQIVVYLVVDEDTPESSPQDAAGA
jgi:hypothetical protein